MIRTGLSSELFLLALLKPDSGYGLAKRLQNTDKTPSTGKIYPVLKSLTTEKYLKYNSDKKKYFPNINKVVSDIVDVMHSKNKSLDGDEIKLLNLMLDRRDFLNALSDDVLVQLNKQPKGIHKIDALSVFCNKIGMLSAFFSFSKQYDPRYVKTLSGYEERTIVEILAMFEKFGKEWEKIDNEPIDEKFNEIMIQSKIPLDIIKPVFDVILSAFKSMPSIVAMIIAPQNTLEKLSNLWDQYEGFKLGTHMALAVNDKSLKAKNKSV